MSQNGNAERVSLLRGCGIKWRLDGGRLAVSSFLEYEKWKRRTMHEAGAKSESSS